MSIKAQVEDAVFLAKSQRFVGALTALMLAIAASSRRVFPRGTNSVEKPKEEMGDREAFTLFLGGRIRKLLFGHLGGPETGNSGISVRFKGKQYDLAYILYKYYRCELIHNGELPENIEFAPSQHPEPGRLAVSISSGEKMILDYGWIDLLINAVVYAECNGPEFGIKHYRLGQNSGVDESVFRNDAVARFGITPGRYEILKHGVKTIGPHIVRSSKDEEVIAHFSKVVESGEINGGAITGLRSYGLSNDNGVLLPKGLEILRHISEAFDLTEIS